ncbi:MAG TPA: hypothetical protein VGZ22_12410 [Isosphaeraceae bacterium]|jgi:hypothetical protein|nr:hypothetical protein [Isosphaeraceae bacterium]
MSSDFYPTLNEYRAGDLSGRSAATPSSIQRGLEHIRQQFHRHLDAIDAMARERSARGGRDLQAKEEQLRKQAAELEQLKRHVQSEADRWERERQAMIEQIDHDRRLLAQAWERLEREQVRSGAAPAERARPTATSPPATWPTPLSVISGHDQPVAAEILRQFQSLRRDVRRTAEAGCLV